MSTINREDAIAIVRNRVKRYTTACVAAVTEIEQLPDADTWTPVTEGKPKDYQHVLVTVKAFGRRFVKDVLYAEDIAKYDDLTFMEHRPGFVDYDSEWGSYEETDVLAWMPLPEPWEGEEK